jgi:hypothetical protein
MNDQTVSFEAYVYPLSGFNLLIRAVLPGDSIPFRVDDSATQAAWVAVQLRSSDVPTDRPSSFRAWDKVRGTWPFGSVLYKLIAEGFRSLDIESAARFRLRELARGLDLDPGHDPWPLPIGEVLVILRNAENEKRAMGFASGGHRD